MSLFDNQGFPVDPRTYEVIKELQKVMGAKHPSTVIAVACITVRTLIDGEGGGSLLAGLKTSVQTLDMLNDLMARENCNRSGTGG